MKEEMAKMINEAKSSLRQYMESASSELGIKLDETFAGAAILANVLFGITDSFSKFK